MENISNQVGSRIRQHRNHKGLTQESLALSSGVNVSFLGDIERGNKKPSIESLGKLLRALGITFQEFFDFETDIRPYNDCTVLEKLNMILRNRPDSEIEMLCSVIQQVIAFNDNK